MKYKVGDILKDEKNHDIVQIVEIIDDHYMFEAIDDPGGYWTNRSTYDPNSMEDWDDTTIDNWYKYIPYYNTLLYKALQGE